MLSKQAGHEFPPDDYESTPPSQRLHLILLGVEDVGRSTTFYEALGWKKSLTGNDGFAKFDLGGYALCLISKDDFAKDAQYESSQRSGFPGVGLIYLAKAPQEVPLILNRAVEAGGSLLKKATRTHWGIAGYFEDPDGHIFEVDYEDAWVFDDEHRLVVDKVN